MEAPGTLQTGAPVIYCTFSISKIESYTAEVVEVNGVAIPVDGVIGMFWKICNFCLLLLPVTEQEWPVYNVFKHES